jgi:hypothetical protein
VILRDGLLVGTQVFMPGQYTLGSGGHCDVQLDDATVSESHAYLYFQNGRAAIQDAGSGAVFVNGHRVNACEVRPVDEVALGPFTLKVRVMTQKAPARHAPPPEVAAILGVPAEPAAPARPVAATVPASRPAATAPVVSSRRQTSAAPQPAEAPQPRTPQLRAVAPVPVDDGEQKTESIALGNELFGPTTPSRPSPADPLETVPLSSHQPQVRAAPQAPRALAAPVPAHAAPTAVSPAHVPQARSAAAPAPVPAPAPAPAHQGRSHQRSHARARAAGERPLPSIPSANEGRGRPCLFVELYWGDTRRVARGFKKIDPKKKLVAREDDSAQLPLWGFNLEGKDFVFAEQKGDLFRVFIPPGAAVERLAQDGNFYPVQTETLEVGPDQRRCVTMGTGHALRLTGANDSTLVAYVQPAIPRPFVNPLRGLPWLVLVFLALFSSAFLTFVFYFAEMPESADFTAKNVNPVAVKLIAPPRPEEKKKLEKLEKKIERAKKKPEKELPKVVEKSPVVPQETKKALKSIEKLSAAGPAMKDLLAAVDKLGSGPGAKNARNDFKLSDLIGKAPIASAGLGTFGLGGGGGGGMGIKGAELLRGKGGLGIGALGAGRIGKGAVAGTVTHAVSRNIGAQGSIDKEAVAKVINSHLHEVSSCYERALLKTPGLAGKIVLEWQITTAGLVGYAKTKSSTMQSPAVESCILAALKTWRFPPAKGAGVIITYPFMFNSVGY